MAHINRRTFVKLAAATAATAAASRLAFPAIAKSHPVRVGAALPFSGGLELFGQQARIGIDLAAAEINAQGGIMGRQIEILYEDMKTDPKTAAEKARKLIQRDEVIAVAGPITSSGRNAMVPHMMRLKTPLLYATNYEGADDEGGGCGRYLFFFNTVPNQDTAPLIPYLKREGIGTSYYMFGANYVWPRNMFEAAKAMIAETGGRTLAEEYTPFGVTDFTSVIRKVAASGADILLFALPGADGITFIKQAGEFGLMNNLTVAFLGFSETYLGAFGRGKGENMYVGRAVRRLERRTRRDRLRRPRAPDARAGHRRVALCDDALQRHQGAQGGARTGGYDQPRGRGRWDGGSQFHHSHRRGLDHAGGPPHRDEHVHRQNRRRSAQGHRAPRAHRAGVQLPDLRDGPKLKRRRLSRS